MTLQNRFELQPTSYEIWDSKYRLKDEQGNVIDQTVLDSFKRVAGALAKVEESSKQEYWYEKFLWAMLHGAVPAGRIMSNAGAEQYKPNTSTINCTVSSEIEDNMDSILTNLRDAGMTLKNGSGIGYCFSTLRPKGAYVAGAGAYTSGPLSFMDIYDKMCFTISSAGGRRGAQMATFDIRHPDVIEFIQAKREAGRLRQFNLSLLITHDFMEAVKKDQLWDFTFPLGSENVYKTIRARELWNQIMQSNYEYAEPGFLLIDEINRMNNNWWCEEVRSTNPCVVGDTLILTKSGYQRIDTFVGSQVEIWNGYRWSEVIPKVTGKNQKIIDICFSDGSFISCTPYHGFILNNGIKVQASELNIGDKLASSIFPIIEGDILENNCVMYTQGFYSGDGDRNRNRIWLYGDKIKLLVYLNFKGWSDQSNLRNKRIMVTLDQDVKSKSFVPDCKYEVKNRLYWLAGLFDSDGTITKKGSLQVSSVDKDFLLNVKLLLNTLGIKSKVTILKVACVKMMPDGNGSQKEYTCKDCWRLLISGSESYKLFNLGIPTHRLNLSYKPSRENEIFVKVISKKIRPILEENVYCFNEKYNHTAIFNGIMTSQCGEQPLPPNGSCLLGSIDLTKFVVKPFTSDVFFDWGTYSEVIRIFTRMLDNVVEINGLPLESQRKELELKRRHGMGYFGLGSVFSMMGYSYGSKSSIHLTDSVTEALAIEGYMAGLELAKEKGPAPIMDMDFEVTEELRKKRPDLFKTIFYPGDTVKGKYLHSNSEYMKRIAKLEPELVMKLEDVGCRFTHHSSIAPTGTLALSFGNNASNGIEPSFAHHYVRNVIIQGKKTKEHMDVYSKEALLYRELTGGRKEELPDYCKTANQITPKEHIDIQAAAQYWIDSSISKTVNVPSDCTMEQFQDIYQYAYDSGLKGCATFRFNPDNFQGVLVNHADLDNTTYQFILENGETVTVNGSDTIEYEGETHGAANLFDALKEGLYGKF